MWFTYSKHAEHKKAMFIVFKEKILKYRQKNKTLEK